MINNVVLVGRITKNPEVKAVGNDSNVCRFTLAANRTFTNRNGEREADFISCVAFGKTAELIGQYVTQGQLIGIEGRIQTGSYDSPSGERKYTTDVIASSVQFLERKGESNNQSNYQPKNEVPTADFLNASTTASDISDDELPF